MIFRNATQAQLDAIKWRWRNVRPLTAEENRLADEYETAARAESAVQMAAMRASMEQCLEDLRNERDARRRAQAARRISSAS